MKKSQNPTQTAAANFRTHLFNTYLKPFVVSDNYYHPHLNPTFDHLNPKTSVTLYILRYILNNPNCTRSDIRKSYPRCISQNTFQNIIWAKLITPRKYTLTDLGKSLLNYYNNK